MSKKKPLSEVMWAIKDPTCGFYCGTYLSRHHAITDFTMNVSNHVDYKKAWKKAYADGLRCVRVRVTEIKR